MTISIFVYCTLQCATVYKEKRKTLSPGSSLNVPALRYDTAAAAKETPEIQHRRRSDVLINHYRITANEC